MRIAQVLSPTTCTGWRSIATTRTLSCKIKQSTTTKICTGENLYYMHDYIPYFERHAADVFMIDVPGTVSVSPRKLAIWRRSISSMWRRTITTATWRPSPAPPLCAVLPNVRIMEIDIDDVPWKDT